MNIIKSMLKKLCNSSPTITFEFQCVACSIEMCGQIMNKDEGKNNFQRQKEYKRGTNDSETEKEIVVGKKVTHNAMQKYYYPQHIDG